MRAHQSHRRSGSPTHQTGRENIRYNTFVPSGVSCRRMHSAVTIGCSVREREGGALTEVACWAHARRKIHDVYISSKSTTAEEALKRISELYAIEDEIRAYRSLNVLQPQQRSKALLTSLHEWMVEKNGTLSKNPDWAKRSAMS